MKKSDNLWTKKSKKICRIDDAKPSENPTIPIIPSKTSTSRTWYIKFTNYYTKSVYKKCMLHPESSEDRLKRLSIPTPHVLYAKHGLIYIFKVLRDQTAKPLSFSSLCCAATRGHSYKLLVPRCNTEIRKNLFFIRLLKVWNSLPECIFSSQSLKSFKSSLRSFDLSGCHF